MDTNQNKWAEPKYILGLIAMVLVAGIVVTSVLRDRIVNQPYQQVSVVGEGRIAYTPDVAVVTLGVRAMKVANADVALSSVSEKMNAVVAAVTALGVPMEDVQTQNLSLYPETDYRDGVSIPSGYTASQQVTIKVRNLTGGSNELVSKVIQESNKAGANEVMGVQFEASNLSELKQQARVKAIEDAKSKSGALAKAGGVRLRKVVGWYENFIQPNPYPMYGGGGMGGPESPRVAGGTLPSGTQEVVVEVGLQYSVR